MYSRQQGKQFHLLPVIIYVGFLIYGTLYPWQGWRVPSEIEQRLAFEYGWKPSYSDIFTNVIVYIPLGFLLAHIVISRSSITKLFVALLGGTLLSFLLESLQIYLPTRVPSLLDLMFNAMGAFVGGGIFIAFCPQGGIYTRLLLIRQAHVRSGALASASLFLLGVWAISQTIPWMPSLDISGLRQELKPLWYVLTQRTSLEINQTIVYALEIAALGLIGALTLKPNKSAFWWFAAFVSVVFILQIPIVGHPLTAEAIVGTGIGILCFILLCKLPPRAAILGGITALLGAIVIDELPPGAAVIPTDFNWVPFRGHLDSHLMGITDTLIRAWPFLALSLLVLYLRPQRPRMVLMWGGISVFAGMFALEWRQQYIAGRYPDITDAALSLLMWWLPWMYVPLRQEICTVHNNTHP
ncbi:MAG: VanZ family protein [Candidatus Nitrosoglobus sp.]|jgi:VanZ family protein